MLNFDPPSRAVEVARMVDAWIGERALAPGDKIATKEELRLKYGVARATVNEAVKLLHERGRVALKPGPSGGLFVARSDPGVQLGRFFLSVGHNAASVADAIALRDFLETMVVEEAVRHRSEADVAELRRCIDAMADARSSTGRLLEAIWALHDRIAAITPNAMLRTTYRGLARFIRDHVTGAPPGKDEGIAYNAERIRIHGELVDVIESGDASRVAAVMKLHNEAG